MRYRFEVQSLSALGAGPHRLPINCWRLTVQFTSVQQTALLEGQDFTPDLALNAAGTLFGLAQFTVGGIPVLPDGSVVNINQVLRITVASGATDVAQGMLIYEYLEP